MSAPDGKGSGGAELRFDFKIGPEYGLLFEVLAAAPSRGRTKRLLALAAGGLSWEAYMRATGQSPAMTAPPPATPPAAQPAARTPAPAASPQMSAEEAEFLFGDGLSLS